MWRRRLNPNPLLLRSGRILTCIASYTSKLAVEEREKS